MTFLIAIVSSGCDACQRYADKKKSEGAIEGKQNEGDGMKKTREELLRYMKASTFNK